VTRPRRHSRATEALARRLPPAEVHRWLITEGYFPENYVLPPCFHVSRYPPYGHKYTHVVRGRFSPKPSQICEIPFPKTELTDLTFGIIDPKIHNDIACEIAQSWTAILGVLFDPDKRVHSYSFPIPLSSRTPGLIGQLRAGRMIYEWIDMAEKDLVEESYAYKYLARTDVKNFYPSVYTHSIAWALHTKALIRSPGMRTDYSLVGNRLDKLFQAANDGCTNGLPIGPAVSDFVAELILSAVDIAVSNRLVGLSVLALRFKDDYRFMCKSKEDCEKCIRVLQKELKEFRLLVNEDKTKISRLPEGIFRDWKSKYHAVRRVPGRRLRFEDFKELYLAVLRIDSEQPGTGVIDRFLADIRYRSKSSYGLQISASQSTAKKIISLLLLLADRRPKVFPIVLGTLETMISSAHASWCSTTVATYLNRVLTELCKAPEDHVYLICWILYFLKSNRILPAAGTSFQHPVLTSLGTNRATLFRGAPDFNLYRGVMTSRRATSLLSYLDVFRPQ
jgi:hypothetical protein